MVITLLFKSTQIVNNFLNLVHSKQCNIIARSYLDQVLMGKKLDFSALAYPKGGVAKF